MLCSSYTPNTLLLVAYLLGTVACGAAKPQTSETNAWYANGPTAVECTIVADEETEHKYQSLGYAIDRFEFGIEGDEPSLKIDRAQYELEARHHHKYPSLIIGNGYAEYENNTIDAGWHENSYWADLKKTATGYEGMITVEEDFGFDVKCITKAMSEPKEVYECKNLSPDQTYSDEGTDHELEKLVIRIGSDNVSTLEIISDTATFQSIMLNNGTGEKRESSLHTAWLDQDSGVTFDTVTGKGKAIIFEDFGFDVECIRE